mgnify:CR=1 FL=1
MSGTNKERVQEQISSYGPGFWFTKADIQKALGLSNRTPINQVIKTLEMTKVLDSRPGKRKDSLEYSYLDREKLSSIFSNTPGRDRPGTHRNGSSGRDQETLQVLCQVLIDKYSMEWKGRIPLEEELELHEAWFLRTRLPWLLFDSFYHFGSNRQGDTKIFPGTKGVPFGGWDVTEDGRKDREIFLSSTKEDLLKDETGE